ncbi:MAG: acetolactate synthase large subunit, partial [Gammaproteobacteria bacterium]|nr:acetolactate synthase large subunit [Gammaproteobacteria bacterium]
VAIVGNLGASLDALEPTMQIDSWRDSCSTHKSETAWDYNAPGDGIYAPAMLAQLSEAGGEDLVVACDVGQHQMWVAQHCHFARPEQHLTSGALGTMGFGLPAAIGAKLANPDATVVCVSGDGSIMMNIQELATLNRYGIAVKILLLDNQALGMVRQWQDLFFDERRSEVDLNDNPDFVKVAESFRIPAFRVEQRCDVAAAIQRLLSEPGPMLAHVCIDPRANVWPLVPPGKSNSTMMEETAK